MKLEVGKRYVRRDGQVTSPLRYEEHDTFMFWDDQDCNSYKEDGAFHYCGTSTLDLIEEYAEEQDEPTPATPATTGGPYVSVDVYNAVVAERDLFRRRLHSIAACLIAEVPDAI